MWSLNLSEPIKRSDLASLIRETTVFFDLKKDAFVEKDFYVTEVLHALSDIKNEDFNLVLIGGTSLSKAHQITQRMSEDLDFKVYPKDSRLSLTTDSTRKKLSRLREDVLRIVQEKVGLFPKENQIYNARNNRYMKILLDYEAHYPIPSSLKPNIQIELTTQHPYANTIEKKAVGTLIYQAFGEQTGFHTKEIFCGSLMESASEKWVSLLKHLSLVEQGKALLDEDIVRHLYDMFCIEKRNLFTPQFDQFVPLVIASELNRLQEENPYLYTNFLNEINQSFDRIKHHTSLEENYHTFIRDMVFQKNVPSFKETLDVYEKLNERAFNAVKENMALKEVLLGDHASHPNNRTTTQEIKPLTDKTLSLQLLDYVQSEIKQRELLSEHYRLRSGSDKELALTAKTTMLVHGKALAEKASNLLQQEDIQQLITKARQIKLKGDPTDFSVIQHHLATGSIDIKTLYPLLKAMQVRQQSMKNTSSQKQSNSRHH